MAIWSGLGTGGTVAASSAAVAVVVTGGMVAMRMMSPEAPADDVAVPKADETVIVAPSQNAEPVIEAPEVDPEPSVTPPSFDVVRVDADGNALVAGQGSPGSTITVLIDGSEFSTAPVDSAGSFAAFFTVEASNKPRIVSLMMQMPDEEPIKSTATVILSPTIALAEAVPEADTATSAPTEVAVAETDDTNATQADDPTVELAAATSLTAPDPDKPATGGDPADVPIVAEAIEEAATQIASDVEPEAPSTIAEAAPEDQSNPTPTPGESERVAEADTVAPEEVVVETVVEDAGDGSITVATSDVADTAPSDVPTEPVAGPAAEVAEPDQSPTQIEPAPKSVKTAEANAPKASDVAVASAPAEVTEPESDSPNVEATEPDKPEASITVTDTSDVESPTENPKVTAEPSVESADNTVEPQTNEDAPQVAEAADTPEEPVAPAVLLADETGIRVLQPGGAGPSGVQSVVIDTISYDPTGEVALGGRGTGEGFVRVYLNNQPIKTTEIGIDGQWKTPLPEVDTGVYTLRVDQLNKEGEVTSRAETPFLREEPAAVAALDTRDAEGKDEVGVVTVQPGNTLWGIASDKYGDGQLYVRVFEANKGDIRNPDLIYPGQIFTIPE